MSTVTTETTEKAAALAAREASERRLEKAMMAHMQAVARLQSGAPCAEASDMGPLSPPFSELLALAVVVALRRAKAARKTPEALTPEEKREIYRGLAHDIKLLLERLDLANRVAAVPLFILPVFMEQ